MRVARNQIGTVSVLWSLALGCSDETVEVRSMEIYDSAGISVVVNTHKDLPRWSIDTTPSVDIGSVEGADGQDLALPWSSLRLPHGRVAVSNARTNELRLYTSDGQFIRAVGGAGEGPGEFGLIAALHLGRGDTIIAADASLPRLNLFSEAGEFGRTITLGPLEGRQPRLRGVVQDTTGVYRVTFRGRSGGKTGMVRDTFLVATRPFDGDTSRVIGRFLGAERFHQIRPNGAVAAWNLPFGRNVYTAVTDDMVWIGESDTYEIRGFRSDGQLKTIIQLDRPLLKIQDDFKRQFFEHQMAQAEDDNQREMYRDVQEVMEFPPTLPAYSALMADPGGNLWVEDYQHPWIQERAVWRIFDSEGRAIATARLPPGLNLQSIGQGYVMGLWVDELDVEHIRVYELDRREGDSRD